MVETTSGRVLGTTGYHNILPEVRRLEIGYTWYGASSQSTHVNTACKLMLLTHALISVRTLARATFAFWTSILACFTAS